MDIPRSVRFPDSLDVSHPNFQELLLPVGVVTASAIGRHGPVMRDEAVTASCCLKYVDDPLTNKQTRMAPQKQQTLT